MSRNSITKQICHCRRIFGADLCAGNQPRTRHCPAAGARSEPGGARRTSAARRKNAWRDAGLNLTEDQKDGDEENPRVHKSAIGSREQG